MVQPRRYTAPCTAIILGGRLWAYAVMVIPHTASTIGKSKIQYVHVAKENALQGQRKRMVPAGHRCSRVNFQYPLHAGVGLTAVATVAWLFSEDMLSGGGGVETWEVRLCVHMLRPINIAVNGDIVGSLLLAGNHGPSPSIISCVTDGTIRRYGECRTLSDSGSLTVPGTRHNSSSSFHHAISA